MQRHAHETAIRRLAALAAAGLLMAGGFAVAQADTWGPPRYGAANPPPFEVVDADGNGVIEPHEATVVGVPFTMLDRDGNGTVSRAEYMTSTAHYPASESDLQTLNQQASSD